jgi:S1-C subfamily serine protease
MDWENYIVKLNVKSKVIDFNHPLNIYETQNTSGTGFFISDREILTCFHVISGAVNIEVLFKQTNSFYGTIKYIFPDDDLAIIELDNSISDAKVLDHKIINYRLSEDVFTVGFPLSSTNIKITKGIISGYQESLIQTDAALNHGNSGGPLVIFDNLDKKYKIIGINVSKLKGDSEKTGFVVPIYRFIILKNNLINNTNKIIKKPYLFFDFQSLTQENLRIDLFKNQINNIQKKTGIRVISTNPKYYHTQYIKQDDVILSVNNNQVDHNGYIKFDFYPEKISLDEIGLWFVENDSISFKIFNPKTLTINEISFSLEIVNSNLMSFYLLDTYPSYFVENNGLILSILTEQHLEKLKSLEISISKLVKILERRLYHRDLFTVYLSDINYTKNMKQNDYPIGEIISEINDRPFNSFDEFMEIVKNKIVKIKTIENEIYFI